MTVLTNCPLFCCKSKVDAYLNLISTSPLSSHREGAEGESKNVRAVHFQVHTRETNERTIFKMRSRRSITKLARNLRKQQTPSEKILWNELRNRKLLGVKFLRQHPLIFEIDRGRVHFFIPDFYSAEQRIVIELDGKIHYYQKNYDYERDLIIKKMGLNVVRFKNEEVRDMNVLKTKIISHFS